MLPATRDASRTARASSPTMKLPSATSTSHAPSRVLRVTPGSTGQRQLRVSRVLVPFPVQFTDTVQFTVWVHGVGTVHGVRRVSRARRPLITAIENPNVQHTETACLLINTQPKRIVAQTKLTTAAALIRVTTLPRMQCLFTTDQLAHAPGALRLRSRVQYPLGATAAMPPSSVPPGAAITCHFEQVTGWRRTDNCPYNARNPP